MCTALHFAAAGGCFGRTLDLDRSYGEEVVVTPRNFPLHFRSMGGLPHHYAMIGMATVVEGVPLYYEAANEHGLAMAGLNFPGNAYYAPPSAEKDNIASFELIPWLLGQYRRVAQVKEALSRLSVVDLAFAEQLPPSPLHWMVSDREASLVVEATRDGLHWYDNPLGVMTNNPPFPYQLENAKAYASLQNHNGDVPKEPKGLAYTAYCQGLGAVGLPGDVSSMSRFVRIAFGNRYAVKPAQETAAVSQFFHLLSTVEMVRGLCKTDEGTWDITGYTACIHLQSGRYYYTTYGNRQIGCVSLRKTDLEGGTIVRFPLCTEESIAYQN